MFDRHEDIVQLADALEAAGHPAQAGRLRVLLNVFEAGDDAAADEQADIFLQQQPVPDDEALWLLLLEILDDGDAMRYASEKLRAIRAGKVGNTLTSGQAAAAGTDSAADGERRLLEREGNARVYDEGSYQMLWDCGYCGTDKLLGLTHRFCPNCGASQDTKRRYFPSEEDMVAVENHKFVGADVICPACETANAANAEFCQQCGSPLTEAARAKLKQQTPAEVTPSRSMSKRTLFTILGSVAALIVVAIVLMTWTRETTVAVTAHAWEREIRIEDFAPRSSGDWCDGMPRDAYRVSRSERQRSTRQVADGETCTFRNVDRGDGTFRREEVCTTNYRSEPVYDTYCSYTVDRWAYARSAETAASDRSPQWATLRLDNNEREAGRNADYFLELRSDDNDYRCRVDEPLWTQAAEGSRWTLAVGAVAGEARCDSLEAAQ
jgi:ribosomal protein L40E